MPTGPSGRAGRSSLRGTSHSTVPPPGGHWHLLGCACRHAAEAVGREQSVERRCARSRGIPRRSAREDATLEFAPSESSVAGSFPDAMTVPSSKAWLSDQTSLRAVCQKSVFGWACLGLVVLTTGLLVLLGSVPESPLVGQHPTGVPPLSVLTHVASAVGLDKVSASQSPVLAYGLIAGACLGFLGVLLAIRERGMSTRVVIGCSAIVITLATLGPPLFSHDVYSYALYGRMWVLLHLNPYVASPSAAANDPFLHVASNGLRSVYGPLFTLISGLIVWIFRSPAATVAALKVLSGASWLGVVVLASRLGRRKGSMQASFAAALVGLNPLVIIRVISGGHNDALVALAIMAALTAWYDGHKLLVTAFLTLGMLIKVVTVIPLIIFLSAMILAESTARDRLATIGKHLAVIVGLTTVALIPFGYSVRSISSFLTLTSLSNGSPRPPEVVLSAASAHVLRSLGWSRAVALSDGVLQVAFLKLPRWHCYCSFGAVIARLQRLYYSHS